MEKYSCLVYFLFLSSTIYLSLGQIECLKEEEKMKYRCTSTNGSLPVKLEFDMDVSPSAVKL